MICNTKLIYARVNKNQLILRILRVSPSGGVGIDRAKEGESIIFGVGNFVLYHVEGEGIS